MKPSKFYVIFLALTSLVLTLHAEDADKALDNNTYIESHSTVGCGCPTPKEGYFARIKDVIPSSGETQCFIYSKSDPSTQLGFVSTSNASCQSQFVLSSDEEYQVSTDNEMNSDEFGLESIKTKYTQNYTNTGTRTYLTTSKYIVAGLTADDEIIDVASTISKNKLTIRSGYTIYPNISGTITPDVSTLQRVMGALGGWWNDLFSSTSADEAIKEQYKGYEAELSSLSEIMFSSVIVLMLTWLAESNTLFLNMNSTLFFWVFPATLVLFLVSKVTKKMGDKQDHEDNFERGFLTALILWVFYFASGETDVANDQKITYTNFQTYSRPILYKGVEFADDLNMAFTKAYISYKAKDAGLFYQQDYKKVADETARLTKENAFLAESGGMLGLCYEAYDTEKLRKFASDVVGANTVFPPLGTLNKDTQGKPTTTKSKAIGTPNLEETAFLNEGYRRATNVPTLSACYNFERRYKENSKVLMANELIKKQYESAINGNKAKEGIKLVADLMFKNSADMGFINASNIASTNILLNNLDLFANAEIKDASVEHTMELDNQLSGYETSNIVSSDLPWYAGTRWLMQNGAYMMVPPASSIKEGVIEPLLMSSIAIGEKGFSWISNLASGAIGGLLKMALKKSQDSKSLTDSQITKSLISFVALILTILFMKQFLTYMPLVAISVASYLAIGFYYVSVEIFYLVAPFVAIYALSADQMGVLKSFISRFLALAFKPPLIVLSVIMAIMAMEIFDKLAKVTSHKTFDSFFAITAFNRTHWDIESSMTSIRQFMDFKDYMLISFKGVLLVGAETVQLLAVFYLVFYGSTMILNMFGFKDSGTDAQDTVGSSFESKTGKFSTGM